VLRGNKPASRLHGRHSSPHCRGGMAPPGPPNWPTSSPPLTGKGRKQRCTPLRPETATMLNAWLRERHGLPENPVFPSIRGGKLSRDAVERLITKYTTIAQQTCPSLKRKNVSPHVLRHAAAMDLLQHGVDRSVIALWLGHESVETTQMYLHADMRLKEKALSRTTPLGVKPGRYRPDDKLLAFLETL
jgi:integrase/recombinase XerD